MTDLRRPANLDAERFTLGGLLLFPEQVPIVEGILKPEDFSLEAHRRIYTVILDTERHGASIDRATVAFELMGAFPNQSWLSILIELDEGLPQRANLEAYAKVVREMADRWRLITTAGAIMQAACDETRDLDEIRGTAEKSIATLAAQKLKAKYRLAGAILDEIGVQNIITPPAAAGGIIPPWAGLEDLLGGFRPGEITILAARPSWGKTAMALQIAARAARPAPTFVVSLETFRDELLKRLLAQGSQTNTYRWPDADNVMRDKLMNAAQRLRESALYISEDPHITVEEIRRALLQINHGKPPEAWVQLVVIDYLQLMAKGDSRNLNNLIGEITRALKIVMHEQRCSCLLLSQLTREAEKEFWAKGSKPNNTLLRDSGNIEQDADNILFLWPDYEDFQAALRDPLRLTIKTELHCTKRRGGLTGQCSLEFVRHHTRFQEQQHLPDPQEGLF